MAIYKVKIEYELFSLTREFPIDKNKVINRKDPAHNITNQVARTAEKSLNEGRQVLVPVNVITGTFS